MGRLNPIGRHDLIGRLRQLGFRGPYAGGRHQFMVRGERRLILPNPHQVEIGVELLSRVLRQAGVDRTEWDDTRG
jgi:predicted RNA binding protein YcfA (HicA-like mRNA interferase family)